MAAPPSSETEQTAGRVPGGKLIRRQERLSMVLQEEGLEAVALNPGPSLFFLTGMQFHLSERPVVALFIPGEPVRLILPELEMGKTHQAEFPLSAYPYGEDPQTWVQAFSHALSAPPGLEHVGVEPEAIRLLELSYLEVGSPGSEFSAAGDALAALRVVKDEDEIQAMRSAVAIAQHALLATLPLIKAGMTEREVAAELTLQLLRFGAEPELPFSPIVATGPNSANPHHFPGDRPLQPRDLLLVDWGASVDGYASDLTRNFAISELDPELAELVAIVARANTAARAAVRPGIPAEEVDRAARREIAAAGFGPRFIHRTGHGLGLQTHEAPYIRHGNAAPLAAGMTFTVEPGIYLDERVGARVEDDVVVTESGAESLSDLPRELVVIG